VEELVSVVMPMYNSKEEELKLAIESILNQTYKNFEFIIVNDCSTNGCEKVVEDYIKKDNRIILLKNEKNSGIEVALNRGIEIAKSNYIIRMDSDDISYENRIEVQMKFLNEHPEYSYIGGRADFFNDTNGIFRESTFSGEIKKTDFLKGTPFIHPTMVLKKDALDAVNGYPISPRTEDYLLQMILFSKGYKGYVIENKVLKYRQNLDTIKRFSKKQRINEVKVKFKGFKLIHIKWYQYIWILKPIIAMLTPVKLLKLYQGKKK
jgi:glycosyltransferase involved in cell wall biosynthesis